MLNFMTTKVWENWRWIAVNFYNTLLVISMVNYGDFHDGLRYEKIGQWIAMNFYNTLLVISMVNYSEFHDGLSYEKIGRWIAVNFYNTLFSLSKCDGEFLQNTPSNVEGELRLISTTHS